MKNCPGCHSPNPDDATVCSVCGTRFISSRPHGPTRPGTGPAELLSAGDFIDERYKVVRELGQGGMGVVYLVKDKILRNREVALKMIHPELVAHPEARRRFTDEVITCLELDHRNIIRVYDLKEWQGRPYFTMDFIEGRSLSEMLGERRGIFPPFNTAETLGIVIPLLDALAYAHKKTIHRDIKPENIMVAGEFPDIHVKVLDFGIAKAMSPSRFSQTAHAMGTAYFMAPEQMASRSDIDHRADLYSVGMVLYEMLTGKMAVGRFKLPGEIVPGLAGAFDLATEKALATEPEERFGSAESMKTALMGASVPDRGDALPRAAIKKKPERERNKQGEKQLLAADRAERSESGRGKRRKKAYRMLTVTALTVLISACIASILPEVKWLISPTPISSNIIEKNAQSIPATTITKVAKTTEQEPQSPIVLTSDTGENNLQVPGIGEVKKTAEVKIDFHYEGLHSQKGRWGRSHQYYSPSGSREKYLSLSKVKDRMKEFKYGPEYLSIFQSEDTHAYEGTPIFLSSQKSRFEVGYIGFEINNRKLISEIVIELGIDYLSPRNYGFHKRFQAFVASVVGNTPAYACGPGIYLHELGKSALYFMAESNGISWYRLNTPIALYDLPLRYYGSNPSIPNLKNGNLRMHLFYKSNDLEGFLKIRIAHFVISGPEGNHYQATYGKDYDQYYRAYLH